MTNEEKEEWAIETVSAPIWYQLSKDMQDSLLARGVWKQEVYDQWKAEMEADEATKRPTLYKQYRRYLKKNPNNT